MIFFTTHHATPKVSNKWYKKLCSPFNFAFNQPRGLRGPEFGMVSGRVNVSNFQYNYYNNNNNNNRNVISSKYETNDKRSVFKTILKKLFNIFI